MDTQDLLRQYQNTRISSAHVRGQTVNQDKKEMNSDPYANLDANELGGRFGSHGGHQKKNSVSLSRPASSLAAPEDRKRSTSHRRVVKKIVRRKVLANEETGEVMEYRDGRSLSPGFTKRTQYEVTTTRIERDGSTSLQRVQTYLDKKPTEFKDLKRSLQMLEQIKNDVENQYFPVPASKQTLRNV